MNCRHSVRTMTMAALAPMAAAHGAVLRVPTDYPTIPQAVLAAAAGDEVLVAPGTYMGVVGTGGKAIRIHAEEPGPGATNVVGDALFGAFVCSAGETPATVIEGFTFPGFPGGSSYAGGVVVLGSSPTIRGCTFAGCVGDPSGVGGAAINVFDGGAPVVEDCAFTGCSAPVGGAILVDRCSSPTIRGCTFDSNASGSGGGAIDVGAWSPACGSGTLAATRVVNCAFRANSAIAQGGAVRVWFEGAAELVNCTFVDNVAGAGGGALATENFALASVRNCILWGNVAPAPWGEISTAWSGSGAVECGYSDIAGSGGSGPGWNGLLAVDGGGNIDADPLLQDVALGDLRLDDFSPCIDAGDNAAVPAGTATDLLGEPRFFDDPVQPDTGAGAPPIVDIGCHERQTFSGSADLNVTPGESIQAAIIVALPGEEVVVQPGTYVEAIDLLGKAITVRSSDPEDPAVVAATVIDGGGAPHVVRCTSGEGAATVIAGLTITGGMATAPTFPGDRGGGLWIAQAAPTVRDCVFQGNMATYGGGIECDGSLAQSFVPSIERCRFVGNVAVRGGGVFAGNASPEIVQCEFLGNSASSRGGAVEMSGPGFGAPPVLLDCVATGCSAPLGGAILIDTEQPVIDGCHFEGNSAGSHGGAMLLINDADAEIVDCSFVDNAAPFGGAMLLENGSDPQVDACTYASNHAANGGGAVRTQSSCRPSFIGCRFEDNWVEGGFPQGGALLFTDGAMLGGSLAIVRECEFRGNDALGPGVSTGGAIASVNDRVEIVGCLFEGNSALTEGGAIAAHAQGEVRVWGSLIFACTAAQGGAVENAGPLVDIRQSTITDNGASIAGGALRLQGGTTTIRNSILWGNNAPTEPELSALAGAQIGWSDVAGCGASGSGWNAAFGTDLGGNIDRDPYFVDAAMGDHRLATHSRCVDAGSNAEAPSGSSTDLDGNPRFVDDVGMPDAGAGTAPLVDMGAYERQEASLNVTIRIEPGGLIQPALDYAIPGDEVVVQPGTYAEKLAIHGGGFALRSSGGAASTVLDGTGLGASILTIDGGAPPSTIVEGFTFANGNSPARGGAIAISGASPTIRACAFVDNQAWLMGGAIAMIDGSSPRIDACAFDSNSHGIESLGGGAIGMQGGCAPEIAESTFTANHGWEGGAIWAFDACAPAVASCAFERNGATKRGGAMACDGACATSVSDCVFEGNSASGYGGGALLLANSSRGEVQRCDFLANCGTGEPQASHHGGAVLCLAGDGAAGWTRFIGCAFVGNSVNAMSGGGAALVQFDRVQFQRCRFRDNVAGVAGGACWLTGSGSQLRVWDCVFAGNSAAIGGALDLGSGTADVRHATLLANVAEYGGGIRVESAATSVANSIVRGNIAPNGSDLLGPGGPITVTASDIGGCGGSGAHWNIACGVDGGGNIDEDPLFIDDDGHLSGSSPAIERGSASEASGPDFAIDLDGAVRPVDADLDGIATPDMGAYELDPAVAVQPVIVNRTAHSVHASFVEAIAGAMDFDELVANPAAIASEPTILLGGTGVVLTSFARWSQPAGGLYVMADGSGFDLGGDASLQLAGELRVPIDGGVEIVASLSVGASGSVVVRPQGALVVDATQPSQFAGSLELQPAASAFIRQGASFSGAVELLTQSTLESDGEIDWAGPVLILGASAVSEALVLKGPTVSYDSVLVVDDQVDVRPGAALTWRGAIIGDASNAGTINCLGDSSIAGDFANSGSTIVQLGTLAVTGTIVNDGTIVGEVVGGALEATGGGETLPGDGLNIGGGLAIGADADLLFPSPLWRITVGGDVAVAIDDPARFAMSEAELRLVAGGAARSVEAMSRDIGPDPAGLDPGGAGRFPIGTLSLAAGAVATLVDALDNDGVGQAEREAVYARDVRIAAGAHLTTAGTIVYYRTLELDGSVDDPANLVPIVYAPGDADGDGEVDGADLGIVLGAWGATCGAGEPCPGDVNGDDVVDGADLGIVLAGWTG